MTTHTDARKGGESALCPDCETQTLGVAFFDLSRLGEWASNEQDLRVANFFQEFYTLAGERLGAAGGRVVKFMGDAGLAAFPVEAVEDAIFALCELTGEARQLGGKYGFDTYLNVSVHVGPVVAGSFGTAGDERYDVIGKTVNIAARLGRRGVTLSAQAFRCLSEDARKRFEKIMRPITYRFRS